MAADLQIRWTLTAGQHSVLEEVAATLPKSWAVVAVRDHGHLRVTVHGPGFTSSRRFDSKTTPLQLTAYLDTVRREDLQ